MRARDRQEDDVPAEEPVAAIEEAPEPGSLEPADLSEEAGSVLDSSFSMLSEKLYIVRERNFLQELTEALEEHEIELREEVEGGS